MTALSSHFVPTIGLKGRDDFPALHECVYIHTSTYSSENNLFIG
jgi:hypothetical protein